MAGDMASSIASRRGNRDIVAAIHRIAKQRRANRHYTSKQPEQRSVAELALSASFPPSIASQMMQTGNVQSCLKASVSILFLDIVDYSTLRGTMPPAALFSVLERVIATLDDLAAQHGVEHIDSFDGCYMAATNYSAHQPDDHAVRLARFALAGVAAAAALPVDPERPEVGGLRLQAGMHSGVVCGCVVGVHGGCKHTLHGDAVNVASRMESHGAAGAVQCSGAAAGLIRAQGRGGGEGLVVVRRGEPMDVKGLGLMSLFWVGIDRDPIACPQRAGE
jgi:adenylate cyclase